MTKPVIDDIRAADAQEQSARRTAEAVTKASAKGAAQDYLAEDMRDAKMADQIASMGHNQPPEPTPFEAVTDRVEALYGEAQHWLDGVAVGEAEAEKIAELVRLLEAAGRLVESQRVKEKAPWDAGAKEVQARYKPLASKVDLAIETARKALAPYLAAKEKARAAEAARLREQAEKAAQEAQEALRATNASDTQHLAAREAAESAAEHAKAAEKLAKKAEAAKTQIGNAGGRAIGMRTVWTAKVVDAKAFARYLWMTSPEGFDSFLQEQAQRYVTLGRRDGLPGVEVTETKVPT